MTSVSEVKAELVPGEENQGTVKVDLLDQVLMHLGDDPALKWLQGAGTGRASPELKNLVAAMFKAASFKGKPGALEKAKQAYLAIFPSESSTFEMVMPRPVYNHELAEAGVPESVFERGDSFRQPLADAQAAAFAEHLPGGVTASLASACYLLQNYPDLIGGRLELNDMTGIVNVGRREIRDEDVTNARVQIELRFTDRRGHPIQIGKDLLWDAVLAVASKARYHPVREYLRSLTWDRVPRLDLVATDVLKAEDTPINKLMFRKFAIGAVARAERPGEKVDNMLVVVGEQGLRKSSFFRTFAGEQFFTDAYIDFENPKHLMVMRTAWIAEFAEMKSLLAAKSEESIKAGLTRTEDRYIQPYGRSPQVVKRHTVFAGTANPEDLLRDPTGNRRYWPLKAQSEIDLEKLTAWRDQLWAEAVAAYDAGEKWFLDKDQAAEAAAAQAAFMKSDSWDGKVLKYVGDLTELARNQRENSAAGTPPENLAWGEFDIGMVLEFGVGVKPEHQDAKSESRVKSILAQHGYPSVRPSAPKGVPRQTFYIKAENAAAFKIAYSAKLRDEQQKREQPQRDVPPPVTVSDAGDFT